MRADLAARLRRTMRGEATAENGVTGVAGVTATPVLRLKPQQLRQLRLLRLEDGNGEKSAKEGVTSPVTAPFADDLDAIEERAALAADRVPACYLDACARLQCQRPLSVAGAALLRTGRDSWSGEDWWAFFDERAGIAEFDGGLPRLEAEARAFTCCVAEWLNRNPVRSPPDRCLRCGEAEQGHDPLLPLGTESTGHAWLHSRCWSAWSAARHAEAAAALEAMGIATPAGFPNDFDKKGVA
jgi:hypothetical protein